MNDIDPAKMTEQERTELFNSFAKDVQPARKPRETIAAKVALWLGGVLAQRERGPDWKQIAALFEENLKEKIAPAALQRAVRDLTRATKTNHAVRKPKEKPATGNSTAST